MTPRGRLLEACEHIKVELKDRLETLRENNKLPESQRLEQRTLFDLEMIRELGYCSGIENYSRYLSGRAPGESPPTMFDYLPDDALVFVDESHVTIPQVGGMYRGDRARKMTLVKHGFRLPSALDNRPLNFSEFEQYINQVVYVSATPGPYELKKAGNNVVEQIIRPTGLMDPKIIIKMAKGHVKDLYGEIKLRADKGQRVLVTTLTKRMSEDLTEYLKDMGIKVAYLHSDIDAIKRVEIIRKLRSGEYDCLVGINLLREGLDIPECSCVAILDADKEGFLRSRTSLIQTMGRAARHVEGVAILYADRMTQALKEAVAETQRRREKQIAYNRKHNITPETVTKNLQGPLYKIESMDYGNYREPVSLEAVEKKLRDLEVEMKRAAEQLDFERAIELRDKIEELKKTAVVSAS